jgi:hypothetical protein
VAASSALSLKTFSRSGDLAWIDPGNGVPFGRGLSFHFVGGQGFVSLPACSFRAECLYSMRKKRLRRRGGRAKALLCQPTAISAVLAWILLNHNNHPHTRMSECRCRICTEHTSYFSLFPPPGIPSRSGGRSADFSGARER